MIFTYTFSSIDFALFFSSKVSLSFNIEFSFFDFSLISLIIAEYFASYALFSLRRRSIIVFSICIKLLYKALTSSITEVSFWFFMQKSLINSAIFSLDFSSSKCLVYSFFSDHYVSASALVCHTI